MGKGNQGSVPCCDRCKEVTQKLANFCYVYLFYCEKHIKSLLHYALFHSRFIVSSYLFFPFFLVFLIFVLTFLIPTCWYPKCEKNARKLNLFSILH